MKIWGFFPTKIIEFLVVVVVVVVVVVLLNFVCGFVENVLLNIIAVNYP